MGCPRSLIGPGEPGCPAARHRLTRRGYSQDGCRCSGAVAAWEAYLDWAATHRREQRQQRGLVRPGPVANDKREIDDCPATRHRHNRDGWYQDGCRCPSTVKAHDARLEGQRRRARERTQRTRAALPKIDLRKANRLDAESIALGHRIGRTSLHTRALAVRMMRQANPALTDREVADRLDWTGQGRWVTSMTTGERRYESVSIRQVQRLQAALDARELRHHHRAGTRLDRSGRAG